MANKGLNGVLDQFIEQLATAVAARLSGSLGARGGAKPGKASMMGSRLCTFPGCPNPGNGPRNRWFCKQHSKSIGVREQKRILAERDSGQLTAGSSAKVARASGPKRKLDMKCRVEGCKNSTRGPRFGYICDEHRKSLSAKEQREAREKYKAAKAA